MGTIPTPPTFTNLEYLTYTELNQLRNVHIFWSKPPACLVYGSTAQTLTTGTWTVLNMGGEIFDFPNNYDGGGDAPMHDNVTNNSRITIRTTGVYDVNGQVQFAANSTAYRMAMIWVNGTTALTEQHQGAVASVSTSVGLASQWVPLTAGDYIELRGYQASGGNLDTLAGRAYTYLQAVLVSSQ